MTLFRRKAEQKLVERGLDPARLPPGQYLTEKWPVLHAGSIPNSDLATWNFEVFGEVERPLTLGWEELRELPATEITVDIHCVTRWSRSASSSRAVTSGRARSGCAASSCARPTSPASGSGTATTTTRTTGRKSATASSATAEAEWRQPSGRFLSMRRVEVAGVTVVAAA